MSSALISIPMDKIANFCRRWKASELAMFGSALRDDFSPESDLDLLISFGPDADWGLLDHVKMQQELQELLQRNVDLVSKRAIEQSGNWLRRKEILTSARVLFSEQEASHATG
jgi:predicted nucleotidyltransferase